MYGMKTIKFFCCLFLLVQSPALLAQQYEVKTIFQLLAVENKKRPLNDPAPSQKDDRREYSEAVMDDAIENMTTGESLLKSPVSLFATTVAHQYLAVKYGMIWYGMSEYATSSIPINELAKK